MPTPQTDTPLPSSLIHLFLNQVADMPNAPAIVQGRQSLSYGALELVSRQVAARFAAAGWGPGRVVGCWLAPLPVMVQAVIALGLARAGAVQLLLGRHELASADAAQSLRRFAAVGLVSAQRPRLDPGVPVLLPDHNWLSATASPTPAAISGAQPWAIGRSSGTTGAPKAFAITHAQEAARMVLHAEVLKTLPHERVMTLSGLGFLTGISCALRCFASGGTLIAAEPPQDMAETIRAMQRHGVTQVWASPSHLPAMLALAPQDAPLLPGLRVFRVGGSALPASLLAATLQRLTPAVHTSYGTNESGGLTAATPEMLARHPETVGRVFPGVAMEVRDESGAAVAPGLPGRVWVRSAANVDGYLPPAGDAALSFRDGWFDTGDIAQIDAEGLVFLRGRADEVMNFDGILVAPREIEIAFEGHPMVAEVAAFARRSASRQDVPWIAVVATPSFDAEALLRYGRARLGTRAPVAILCVREMPRNAIGKILRRELAARADRVRAAP